MSRLTRKESHALTRERLIETAARLFLADGYNATSLEKVATEAGFSKGAVYSNFATKHELGLAVLDVIHLERALSIAAAVEGAQGVEDTVAAFEKWAEENIGDVGWTSMEVEFATSTRHMADVRSELAQRRRAITDLLGAVLEGHAEKLGLRLPVPTQDAAVHLLSLGIGLGVQRAFDPELPVRSLVDHLNRLIESATPL
jgi:AcrR family transcriptional regulator